MEEKFYEKNFHNTYGTFANTLVNGYCFYDQYGNVVNISNIKLQGNFYNLENVTVGAIK